MSDSQADSEVDRWAQKGPTESKILAMPAK
jgi:hypothetical protein